MAWNKQSVSWCPNGAIVKSIFTGQYDISETATADQLRVAVDYISRHIRDRERDLSAVERKADIAHGKANSHNAKRKAKFGSFTRSFQDMQHTGSSISSATAEKEVEAVREDIRRLEQLKAAIESKVSIPSHRNVSSSTRPENRFCLKCGTPRQTSEQVYCGSCGSRI
jgi:hypothetical protein